MATKDIALMAHLMRRAGFGAAREELEVRAAKGYEATVEELVDPAACGIPAIDEAVMFRHQPGWERPGGANVNLGQANWLYRMINSPRPLQEKMTLFWHHVFATGASKIDNTDIMLIQIEMLRNNALGNYRELLLELSKNPAMIYWLDNNENHADAPNENWGRELLELFAMGQGNYSEDDVKVAARAFTGWTISPKLPRQPYGRFPWLFEYRPEDHDDSEKVFLGEHGRFGGEDIIDIVVSRPATPRFIARHLYNFFVADEVQVPSWLDVAPRDPEAIKIITDTLVNSNFDLKTTMRTIFNSDFFKDESAWYAKVKSPAEVVAGTMRLVKYLQLPRPDMDPIVQEAGYQGQSILDPPSVEGWHTGQEWIDTGSLVRRINFVADWVSNTSLPGIQSIIERVGTKEKLTPEELVDSCIDLMGPARINEDTRKELIAHSATSGDAVRGSTEEERATFARRVGEVLQLIASTREYQFG